MGAYQSTLENTKEKINSGTHPDKLIGSKYPVIFETTDRKELELLLDNGADINLEYGGKTALTRAALKDNYDHVKLLLLYGAEANPVINDNKFSETEPVLSETMTKILCLYGYPNEEFEKQKKSMMERVESCLESIIDVPFFPGAYARYIRQDDYNQMQVILDNARMYDHIRENVDDYHAMLWMADNGFSLNPQH